MLLVFCLLWSFADLSSGYVFVLFRYYEGLQQCLGLYSENGQYSSDEVDQLDALYQSLSKQYKWSSAAKVSCLLQNRCAVEDVD